MISKSTLEAKLKEAGILMQNPVKKEFADLVYDKIGKDYEEADLTASINEIMFLEYPRLSFPSLLKGLNTARAARMDRASRDGANREYSQGSGLAGIPKPTTEVAKRFVRAIKDMKNAREKQVEEGLSQEWYRTKAQAILDEACEETYMVRQ